MYSTGLTLNEPGRFRYAVKSNPDYRIPDYNGFLDVLLHMELIEMREDKGPERLLTT